MKRQFLLTAALAGALMLVGCDDMFGGDEVTVTVTDTANVRDAATTDGSNVIGKLEAGTELSGEWVTGASDSSERWFAYERDGKIAYIWDGNLKQPKALATTNEPREPSQPATDVEASNQTEPTRPPRISREVAIAEASAWADCAILFPVVNAEQIRSGNTAGAESTFTTYKIYYNISRYTLIYAGFSDQEARLFIKERRSPARLFLVEPGYLDRNVDSFKSLLEECLVMGPSKMKGPNRDPLVAYIMKNHDISVEE